MNRPAPDRAVFVSVLGVSVALLQRASGFQGPFAILDKLRSQRADDYVLQLKMLVAQRRPDTFLSGFEPEPGDAEFQLGWTLPQTTVRAMDAQISKRMRDDSDLMAELLRSMTRY